MSFFTTQCINFDLGCVEMAKDIRERIIREALREINCRGSDFHMDDLARNLRISKRTLYEHFVSKQAIIEESLLSMMSEIQEEHRRLLADPDMTTEEKIISFFKVKSNNITVLSVRKTTDLMKKMPDVCKKLEVARKADWDILGQLLDIAQQEDDFKPFDKFLLLHMLYSAADDVINYFDKVKHDYSFPEYMERCICVILYGIKTDRGQLTNDKKA